MTTTNKTYSAGLTDALSFMVTLGEQGGAILAGLGGYITALDEFARFISDATEFWDMTYKTDEEALVDWQEYCEFIGAWLAELSSEDQIRGHLPSLPEIREHCASLINRK
jgi:hypothetical protein